MRLNSPIRRNWTTTQLRALCVFKPHGSHRPLGLPECETRFFLACLAAQERPGWSKYYTCWHPSGASINVIATNTSLIVYSQSTDLFVYE